MSHLIDARFVLIAFTLLVVSSPNAFAQESAAVGAPEDPQTITVVTVPKLSNALMLEANIGRRFCVSGNVPTVPLTFGGAIGWRQFLEAHGRVHLRFAGNFEFGSDRLRETEHFYLGGLVGLNVRGYTDLFAFGGTGLGLTGGYLSFTEENSGDFGETLTSTGFDLGLQYEASFGTIAWSEPYLFAEIALTVAAKYIDLGPYSGFVVGANWALRFDWAFKDADFYTAPDTGSWE